jgi:hypothetical protein
MELSEQLLGRQDKELPLEVCHKLLSLELMIEEAITNTYINEGQLICWLQDEFQNLSKKVMEVSEWLDGSRFGKRDPTISYQKLMAAQMIRHGYSIYEEVGIGFIVLDLNGNEFFTNLNHCNCPSETKLCEHTLFAKEYSSPNRQLLKEITFNYVPATPSNG